MKGKRVEIIDTEIAPAGVVGTVFWHGESKFEKERVGVRGDDGMTYWADTDQIKESDAKAPNNNNGRDPDRGSIVKWKRGEDVLQGEVFWIGPDKYGEGMRIGVRDGEGEKHWLSASWVEVLDEPVSSRPSGRGAAMASHALIDPPF